MKRLAILPILALCLAPAALAEGDGAPADGNVSIQIAKDMEIRSLLDAMAEATGRPVLYDPNSQRIRGQKVGVALDLKVPQSRLFDAFRSVLMAFELSLVPVGPNGYEVYLAVDSRSTNNFIKNRAVFLESNAIETNRDRDGLFVATFLPVKHAENMTLVRTALSTMVSPAGIGRVMEIPGSGIIIMDFAPSVYTMKQVVDRLDQPSPTTQVLESIELSHAKATEVAGVVQNLWTGVASAPVQAGRRTSRIPSPAPRVLPYAARNAVIVRATRGQMEKIRALIKVMDQPRANPHQIEVLRLKFLRADQLAHTLTAMIAAPTVIDPKVQIVPDPQSNSVIIASDRRSIAAVKDIVAMLDVAPLKPTFR